MTLLVLLILLLRWVGENSVLLATLLYLPWQVFLLPLLVLMPLQLGRWPKLLIQCLFLLLVVVIWPGWRASDNSMATEGGRDLVMINYNGGDTGYRGFGKMTSAYSPDLLVLQEARHYLDRLREDFADYQMHREDEFVLLSKLPVKASETIYLDRGGRGTLSAARFLIDFHGQPIVLYNVHLQTPRKVLEAVIHNPLELFHRQAMQVDAAEYWQGMSNMLNELKKRANNEQLPVILAGDFNVTARGMLYRRFSSGLKDGHKFGGSGYGHTFPFDAEGMLKLLQPWLRIDYVFTSESIQPLAVQVIRDGSKRQHLPLVVHLSISKLP